MASHVMPPLSIRLLGPLEVAVAGRPVTVDTRKALAIIALVAAEGRPFARDELAAMFWPEADDEAARGALRRTLSSLRTAIGGVGMVIGRAQIALDPVASTVDLIELERLSASGRAADLEAAAALARGPFLAGFALRDSPAFDDWQAARAGRVERTVGDLLERLAGVRLDGGDVGAAVEASRRRVELDPLDEVGQRRLIELLARAGQRTEAIRQYRELVALFDRELGVGPLRDTTDLYDAIREGHLDTDSARASLPAAVTLPPLARPDDRSGRADDAGTGVIPLVGREQEVAAITAAWLGSAHSGRIVLVEGEAGIGKTRLGEVVAAEISASSGIVLAARGYPGESAIAYGPIAELLRAGLATPDAVERLSTLDEVARREIGRLVDLPAALRVPGGAGFDGASARVRLLDAVADALGALVAGPMPGFIWIDDVHLADDSTREALVYFARRLHARPVLLLLAWRREDFTLSGSAMAADLEQMARVTSLPLRRLDRHDVAAIAHAMRPGDVVDNAMIDALAAVSEGLPLHVIAALASGDAAGNVMPRGVRALLRERITSVSETAAQVLAAAAVIGRSFDLATVRQSSGRSEDETVDAMDELLRRGIVREVPGVTGPSARYDFSHGRMRDVAYEAASLARRRLLHRRTADALRLDPAAAGWDDRTRFALIAGHEREAGRAPEAAAAFMEAADRAEAVFANREAIDHLESAIALGHRDVAIAEARVGELQSRLGEYPAAIAAFETAAAFAEPRDLAAIEIALGRVHRRRGDLAAAASHLGSALASADLDDSLRARALVERSIVSLRAGDLEAAGAAASAARETAGRVGNPHLAGVAERLVGLIARERGDLDGSREALSRSIALAVDDPDPTAWITATTGLALALAAGGSLDEAVRLATSATEACRRIGDRHLEAAIENHLADIFHAANHHDESMAHLKRAVALFADVGDGALERDPGIWTLAAW